MRVDTRHNEKNPAGYSPVTGSVRSPADDSGFGVILKNAAKKKTNEEDYRNFEKVSLDLEAIEKRFLKNPNQSNYRAYADFVRSHVRAAQKDSRKMKKLKDKNSREYFVVIQIDSLLDDMLEMIYYEKKEIIRLLRMMSQIQGLLFDILV